MSTKAVLEALAAGAGRQSAIGGLMFQDAQKREAQGYELALQKEKWRRSGETSALENAMKGYKANWESYTKTFNKLNEIYWRAKSGQASEGYDIATTDLTELNDERLKYWDLSQHSKQKFLEYSGITYEPEPMPSRGSGGMTTKQEEVTTQIVDAVGANMPDNQLRIYHGQNNKVTTETPALTIDALLEQAEDMRTQAGLPPMTDAEKKTFRKEMRAKLKILGKEATVRYDTDRFRVAANPQSVRNPQVEAMLKEQADIEVQNQALQGTGVNVQDMYIPDPYTQGWGEDQDFVKKAEEKATQRAKERGLISEDAYTRSYLEAQKAMTQILQERGQITREDFMNLVKAKEIKGIELQAYQRAYSDFIRGTQSGVGTPLKR